MPEPQAGKPIGRDLMAGYVFSVSLDLTVIGRDSGVAKLKNAASVTVPADDLNFQLEFIALAMSAFMVELQRLYGQESASGILRTAAGRLSEFYQSKMGKKGDAIPWVKVPQLIFNSVQYYSATLGVMATSEGLARIVRSASERLLKTPDPSGAMAIADHLTRMVEFARGFVQMIPLVEE